MFITNSRRFYKGTSQYASGLFLMIFVNELAPKVDGYKPLRALVRKVALEQCGHFMMGHTTLMGHCFYLSGTYGSNGLPIDVTTYLRDTSSVPPKPTEIDWLTASEEVKAQWLNEHRAHFDALAKAPWRTIELVPGLWERLHPLPPELVTAFWKGGGHNDAGAEANLMFMWASTHVAKLKHLLPKPQKEGE